MIVVLVISRLREWLLSEDGILFGFVLTRIQVELSYTFPQLLESPLYFAEVLLGVCLENA